MPKKTEVKIDANTAREIEKQICSEISGWAESMENHAALGAESRREREAMNDHLGELCPLLRARDAAIEASTTGRLDLTVFNEYAPKVVRETLGYLAEMNVPEGTLAYYRNMIQASIEIEGALAA